MRVLANDGISKAGIDTLEAAGFQVDTTFLEPVELADRINDYDVLLVRSATKVRVELIDKATNIKIIGRGGVGMDNIDVEYARSVGKHVINTPAASSNSVAELVFAHLTGMCRFLPQMNRAMPDKGASDFKTLKKSASKGKEIYGKTLGIMGIGRIGKQTARIAVGAGMKVIAYDPYLDSAEVDLQFHPDMNLDAIKVPIKMVSKEECLEQSDFISMHIPGGQEPVLQSSDFDRMKDGAGLIHCARGGVVDEAALKAAIESGKLAYAALDVFENEPNIDAAILKYGNVSYTPHIGAATTEAQDRIGLELADQIISLLK
jgi:D-3-phosphoglycerate dehydrogenase / 2-oxoglutarate reductase